MDLDKIPFRPTVASAFYALMPYLLANVYMTLVINWPGMQPELHKLNMHQLGMIPQLNFAFCIYGIATVVALILERFIGAMIVHAIIIFGFFLGIGIIYAVIVPLQVLVNPYISAALLINSVIAILAMVMFYVELIKRWAKHRENNFSRF